MRFPPGKIPAKFVYCHFRWRFPELRVPFLLHNLLHVQAYLDAFHCPVGTWASKTRIRNWWYSRYCYYCNKRPFISDSGVLFFCQHLWNCDGLTCSLHVEWKLIPCIVFEILFSVKNFNMNLYWYTKRYLVRNLLL